MRHPDIFAGILVGGFGKRMGGVDKARLRDGELTFIERLVDALRPSVHDVLLSGRTEQSYPEVDARVVSDRRADAGPLAGLEALLLEAPAEWCFLVGCDMPEVDAELLDRIAAARTADARIVVPTTPAGLEPTCALYHRSLAERVSEELDAGRRALHHLARDRATVLVGLPGELLPRLRNVNRSEDLEP